MKTAAIITSGGMGKRMNAGKAKQYLEIAGKPLIVHTLNRFRDLDFISELIIVVPPQDVRSFVDTIIKPYKFPTAWKVVAGGVERQHSVKNGLDNVSADCDVAIIHDGVRPFVTRGIIKNSVEAAAKYGACVVAMPLKETIKKVNADLSVENTVDRNHLWGAQTPQTFKKDLIEEAFDMALQKGFIGTDDAMLVEKLGHQVKIVEGSYHNIKVTTPEDLEIANAIASSFTDS